MKGLTKRQNELLTFIQDYIDTHNHSPTYRQIMNHFHFSSLGTVYKHVNTLKKKNALKSERKLVPADPPQNTTQGSEVELPFIGYLTAGQPIELFPQTQTLAVPDFLVPSPKNTYVLRARGSALHEELITEGDLILVEARNEAYPGETVVGSIHNEATFVKKYFPEGNKIRLEGRNQLSYTLPVEDVTVQGVVSSLLRLFH